MKSILVLIFTLTCFSSFADTASNPCRKEALDLVSSLELIWADLNGPIQGDVMEDQLSEEVVELSETSITYKVASYHTNEDGQEWENNYQVTFNKSYCSMENYSFLGYTEIIYVDGELCVSKDVAKENLKNFFKGNYNTTPVDWFFWLDEGDEDHLFTEATAEKALNSLYWETDHEEYVTGTIFDGYCAAGAECWGGFRVNCSGEADTWYYGED